MNSKRLRQVFRGIMQLMIATHFQQLLKTKLTKEKVNYNLYNL